jgi:hypothetical protein
MHTLILAASMFLCLAEPVASAKVGSVGVSANSVEVLGVNGSYFPMREVSLDARLTLVSVDAGISVHLPFSGPQHAVVLSALGGFRHALLHDDGYLHNVHTGRFSALAGYGFLGDFDVRVQLGLVAERTMAASHTWHPAFAASAYVGKTV